MPRFEDIAQDCWFSVDYQQFDFSENFIGPPRPMQAFDVDCRTDYYSLEAGFYEEIPETEIQETSGSSKQFDESQRQPRVEAYAKQVSAGFHIGYIPASVKL